MRCHTIASGGADSILLDSARMNLERMLDAEGVTQMRRHAIASGGGDSILLDCDRMNLLDAEGAP